MFGFKVYDHPKANGTVHARVLRTLLTTNLKCLIPSLHEIMAAAVKTELADGAQGSGGSSIPTLGTHLEKLIRL